MNNKRKREKNGSIHQETYLPKTCIYLTQELQNSEKKKTERNKEKNKKFNYNLG
jgi:hypothetical protein